MPGLAHLLGMRHTLATTFPLLTSSLRPLCVSCVRPHYSQASCARAPAGPALGPTKLAGHASLVLPEVSQALLTPKEKGEKYSTPCSFSSSPPSAGKRQGLGRKERQDVGQEVLVKAGRGVVLVYAVGGESVQLARLIQRPKHQSSQPSVLPHRTRTTAHAANTRTREQTNLIPM